MFKRYIKPLILSTLILLICSTSWSQVTSTKYELRFSPDSLYYDCYLFIEAGNATSIIQRTQFNSQVGIIVPTGSKISMVRSYMPLKNNTNYNGTIPTNWNLLKLITSPEAQPESDFYSANVSLNAQYNNLSQGEEVKLFSVRIDSLTGCIDNIRLFTNDVDPGPNDPGMMTVDCSNGFTLGGTMQLYSGNIVPALPNIASTDSDICPEDQVLLETNPSGAGLWSFPFGIREGATIDNLGNGIANLLTNTEAEGVYSVMYRENNIFDFTCIEVHTPQPTIYIDTFICRDERILQVQQDFANYNWSTSETTKSISINQSNTYSITVSDSYGCSGIDSIAVQLSSVNDVSIEGLDTICIGNTTNLYPASGGTWESNNTSVAIVNVSGLVTGITQGNASFIFTESNTGCQSTKDIEITVSPFNFVTVGSEITICIGSSFSLPSQSSTGIWTVSDPAIATISDAGVLTAIGTGTVTATFTPDSSCEGQLFNISCVPLPQVISSGGSILCIGSTMQLFPSTGGFWMSNNPDIATVSVNGVVNGVSSGTVSFVFHDAITGCVSDPIFITVYQLPNITILDTVLCVGANTMASPSTGGIWTSSNLGIGMISNSGLVTAISPGLFTIFYTESSTGCSSNFQTVRVAQSGVYNASVSKTDLEVDDTATLSPSGNVTWYTSDNLIVSIINNSTILGISNGTVTIYCIDNVFGCRSEDIEITVTGSMFSMVGYAFTDTNGNGLFDAQVDSPLPNCAIHIPSINGIYLTDKTGYYNIVVEPGIYDVYFTVPFGDWMQDTIFEQIVIDNKTEYLFAGFQPNSIQPSSIVTIHPSPLVCGTTSNMDISIFNNSSHKQSGYILFAPDQKTSISTTQPFPIGGQDPFVIWDFIDLLPGHSQKIEMSIDIPLPSNLGELIAFKAIALTQSGDTLSTYSLVDSISCSFEASSLLAWPDRDGVANATFRGEKLNYLVRFKNPNQSFVQKIEIKNILDKNIDKSSIIVKESSHPVKTFIQDDFLYFIMDSIDFSNKGVISNNEAFVSFECNFDPSVADGTVISNQMSILVDSVQFFESNKTYNTVVSSLPCYAPSITANLCPNQSVQIGNLVYTTPGFYIDVIEGIECDSLVSIQINEAIPTEITLTLQSAGIQASQSAASYHWYDCGSNSLVAVTESPIFAPEYSGSFYVQIPELPCNDKSECISYQTTSVDDSNVRKSAIQVFPNPFDQYLTINTEHSMKSLVIRDLMGNPVYSCHNSCTSIILEDVKAGAYILEVKLSNNEMIRQSIIKL